MARTAKLAASFCCALLLAPACTAPPEIQHVAQRLDSSAFGEPADGRHAPMAAIGNTARPVVAAPRRRVAWEAFGVAATDGKAVAPVSLPAELAELDSQNFSLDMQAYPQLGGLDEDMLRDIAKTNFWRRLDAGWMLTGKGAERSLVVQHDSLAAGNSMAVLRLIATEKPPSRFASNPFELGRQDRLLLHFGPAPGQTAEVRFSASLLCEGHDPIEIANRSLTDPAGSENRWFDADFTADKELRDCRLELASESGPAEIGGSLWAWPEVRAPAAPATTPPNVILLGLDTLRADHLSGYGYPRATSPTIDAELIARGTLFENVSTTFPQTDVAHLSLFTGLYPAAQPERGRLSGGTAITTLAEALQNAGFLTAAITENALVSGAFGFWFGFDVFRERSVVTEKLGPTTFADAHAFIREHREEQFFLFLHTYQTHDPYDSSPPYNGLFKDDGHWENGGPPPWVPEKKQKYVDAYDRTIRETDDLVRDLLATLDQTGIADRTLIVLFSDHGEAFGEHTALGHGFSAHEEQLRVPLVFRGPGIPAGQRIGGPASLADVAPTLLELLGLPALPQGQGTSLAPAIAGAPLDRERPVFFSWIGEGTVGARTDSWKVTRSETEARNYDMTTDPFEWHTRRSPSLPPERQAVLDEYARTSETLRARLSTANDDNAPTSIPERTEDALRALGYID